MSIPIHRLIRSNRSSIALIVHPDATLEVRAPHEMPEARIRGFVASHAAWIEARQAHARANPPPPKRSFTEGSLLAYQGRAFPLKWVPRQRPAVVFDGRAFLIAASAQPRLRAALERFYRAEAARLIPPRVAAFARQHGYTYQRIRISSARTRWGSCSTSGTLSFCWRLMLAPKECLDYVILHELVHTTIHGHGRDFWSRLEHLFPQTPHWRAWLRDNGKTLTLD